MISAKRLCFLAAGLAVACVRSAGRTSPTPALVFQGAVVSEAPSTPVVVELTPYIGRLFTARAVLGSDTLRLIFDTGGGQTALMPDVARRMGCAPAGAYVGFRMTGERVKFAQCPSAVLNVGGLAVRHTPIGVFDLMSLLPSGVPRVDGVLSLATFAGQTITLDLACRRLIVESPASARERVSGMRPVAMRVGTGPSGGELTILLGVESGTLPLWFELDSGNMGPVLVSPSAASLLNLPTVPLDSSFDARLVVSGLGPLSAAVAVRDLIYDGALNAAFVARGEFTFDLHSGRGWAAPVSDTPARCAAAGH